MDERDDYAEFDDCDDPALSPPAQWTEALAPIVATIASFAFMAGAFILLVQ
jgi:hypothetical protein